MLECWSGPKNNYSFPQTLKWEYKSDTDFYCLLAEKTFAFSVVFSPSGEILAVLGADRKVSVHSVIFISQLRFPLFFCVL